MVWVYEEPLTADDRKVQKFLEKRFQKKGYSEKVVKLLTLYHYLKKHKFRSPKQIQEHFFYDKKHERPIFDEKTAKKVYLGLKQKGGGEYPYSNKVIQLTGEFIKSYDPTPVSGLVENGFWLIKQPSEMLKGVIGEGPYELASLGVNGLIETGVSSVNGVAMTVAGPIGIGTVGLFTGIAAAVGAALAMVQGDFGQAVVHVVNFLPGIGPAVVKGMTKLEKLGTTIARRRQQIVNIPLVGETINSVVPDLGVQSAAVQPVEAVQPVAAAAAAAGGNRFSTRRRNLLKCPKTLRNKCV
jgi:hypothetical protein